MKIVEQTPITDVLKSHERRLLELENGPRFWERLIGYATGAFFGTLVGVLIGNVLFQ